MTTLRRAIVVAAVAAFVLGACSSGELEEQSLLGQVSFAGWDGPIIGGATMYMRFYEQAETGGQGPLVKEHIVRGLNVEPSQQHGGEPFAADLPSLMKGETYLIEVHVDVDLDGVASSGDAVTVELFSFEAKEPLDTVVITVVRVP